MAKQVEMLVRPDWWHRAACAGVGPEVFFDPDPAAEQAAKAICAACTTAQQCRDWAIAHRISFGIFGGLTVVERAQLSRLVGAAS
jgi:WhiB family redox-sensing transcriptional regulator